MQEARGIFVALAVVGALLFAGCARELDDSTPEGAAALFIDALARGSDGDPEAREEAFRLLDESSRRRLTERARSTTALGAREYEPWEMLVEGRSRLRFTPRRGSGVRVSEDGEDGLATVLVTGQDESQRVEIPMVLEEDGWRVVLGVPELRGRERPADPE